MKDSTKKILLASGGIIGGCIVASVGGGFLGSAIAGVLLRTGVMKAGPAASKELIEATVKTGNIVRSAVTGTVCTGVGVVLSSMSGRQLGEELYKMKEERASIVAPPPHVSRMARMQVIDADCKEN